MTEHNAADDSETNRIELLATDAVEAGAMMRDRTGFDPEPFEELKFSILENGLRMPIEVYALPEPCGGKTHGLISGARRLAAFEALREMTGKARWATIPAFVRAPGDMATAMAAMVEENEIRAEISPWEKGLLAMYARDRRVFGTIEEAVDRLFPRANPQKRSRVRALARLAEALEGTMTAPERLTQGEALRLAAAVRGGFGEAMRAALQSSDQRDHAAQWAALGPLLAEFEAQAPEERAATPRGGRPRRVLSPRYGVTIRRERIREGWVLRFTGREATGMLMDTVMDEIERMFAPG